jgi:hypothetical protein
VYIDLESELFLLSLSYNHCKESSQSVSISGELPID